MKVEPIDALDGLFMREKVSKMISEFWATQLKESSWHSLPPLLKRLIIESLPYSPVKPKLRNMHFFPFVVWIGKWLWMTG